jgi:DNA polymerase-4
VTVKIRYADFRQATRSRTLPAPVTSRQTLHEVSLGLMRSVFPPVAGIRLIGVTLSGLEPAVDEASGQLDLGLDRLVSDHGAY